MGLFKKNKVTPAQKAKDELFRERGQSTISNLSEKDDRKVNSENIKNIQYSENRKLEVKNELQVLRTKLEAKGYFDLSERLTSVITDLGDVDKNLNAKGKYVIDNFLLNKINECISYVNTRNEFAMNRTIGMIEEYATMRLSGDPCYEDDSFVKMKIIRDNVGMELENLLSKKKSLQEEGRKLQQMYSEPQYASERKNIAMRVNQINTEIDMRNKEIERVNIKINNFDKQLSEFRQHIRNTIVINKEDYEEIRALAEEYVRENYDNEREDIKANEYLDKWQNKPQERDLKVEAKSQQRDEEELPETLFIHD